jgi:hypothetical protein
VSRYVRETGALRLEEAVKKITLDPATIWGLPERGLSLRYTRVSFGTRRILGLWGPPGESTHTFGGAEIATTDGFGQNRDGHVERIRGLHRRRASWGLATAIARAGGVVEQLDDLGQPSRVILS